MRKLHTLLATLSLLTSLGANWYISPNVAPGNGTGTEVDPWSINVLAMSPPSPSIKAGDTIYLRSGIYAHPKLQIRTSNVTISSAPGEWAKIDLYSPSVDAPFIEFLS